MLRATFPGIRDSVRVLLKVRMDRLDLKFHETQDAPSSQKKKARTGLLHPFVSDFALSLRRGQVGYESRVGRRLLPTVKCDRQLTASRLLQVLHFGQSTRLPISPVMHGRLPAIDECLQVTRSSTSARTGRLSLL